MKAAGELRKSIDKLIAEDANVKVVCMGDFNDYPTDKSIESVLRARTGSEQPGDLINLMAELDSKNQGSYNYRGDWGTLDQFIVSSSLLSSQGLRTTPDSAFIVREEWMLFTKDDKSQVPSKTYAGEKYTGGYSDHLPVGLILSFK